MATSKTYTISTDFPNQAVDAAVLANEVSASAVKVALDRVDTLNDSCSVYFKADLDAADESTLDAVVAAHTGEPVIGAPRLTLARPDGQIVPFSPEGVPILAPTFEETHGLQPQWKGNVYTATAGATSIFDELVDTEKQIRGGWYEIFSGPPVVNDYIEFAVVDKDDVLGLFATYGLTVGEDVLELQKYVAREYVNPNATGREYFMANSVWPLIAGLYMRSIYVSTGADDVIWKVVTLAYEEGA